MDVSVDPLRCMRLNERRQAQAIAGMGDEHERRGPGVLAFMEGTPWLCKAVALDLEGPLDDGDVAGVVDYFRARSVPPVLELTSFTDEATFAAAARAGFALVEVEHVLSRSTADLDVPPPAGVSIVPLDREDPVAMRRHAEIVSSAFPPPVGEPVEPLLEAAERSHRHPDAVGLFARLERGEDVAASGMEVTAVRPREDEPEARLTALWGTTVLPEHRRRGIQRALIAHRLRIGRARGSELAVVESRPGIPTERNAARLGFRLTYTRLTLKARA